ncbi:HEAT domain protein repeat-containing protein [Calothrix parasitica NIES-267]|uniref:HEAT domain protein repeat-containing protein n=1 Tax=Calothrix parasitica NIES-267 TaxID=1973488 RepID=A0A1Z4LPG5_9CYAN|nr:HEAT domain protein repeat-containing protein [Calothrix parasitica NIES-267]
MSSYSLDDLRESMVKILNPDNNNVAGSGFIIREDGYLITCHHVIYLLNSLQVEYRGKEYEADWCAEFSNPEKDIAVLKINVEDAKAAPIINPSNLSTSVKVYGFPPNRSNNFPEGFDVDGKEITASAPINCVSTYKVREIENPSNPWNKLPQENSTFDSHRIINANGKVDSGTSGGAVFSEELGGVVGVIQSTKKSEDQSYVIRWDNIRHELERLGLEPQKNAVCEFLEDIENNFKYIQLFHSKQQQIVLKEQYIPIQVSLETKRKDVEEFFVRDVESGNELKRIYAIKGIAEETQRTQVDWKEAKQKHQKIMVLADPGMGKSTLLRMEAGLKAVEERLNLAANSSSQLTARIENLIFPLFLRLSDLDEKSGEVIDIIPEIIQQNYPKTTPGVLHLLQEKLQQGKCWLFLDALDEVPKENRNDLKDKINRFTNNYPCRIICTSRIVGYGGAFVDAAKEVEIVPFTPKQTEEYIQTWFTNAADYIEDDTVSAEKLITELQEKPQISGLTQNPLLLSLVCSLYQTKGLELPARKAQVYQKAVDYMLREWRNDNNRLASEDGWVIAKIELLESLAYQFSCEGKEVFTLREIRDDINKFLEAGKGNDFRNITTTELISELCEEDGIIQKLTREGEQYLFLHRTFQEYFTAAYLNREIEKNQRDGIALARKLFWEYDFHETLILLAGLMENPFPLIKAIANEKDDIFKTQLLLAGKCIAECESYGEENQKFVEKIVDRIYKFWRRYRNTSFVESVVVILGKSNSRMVDKLILYLNDSSISVRENAAEALGRIGNPIAVEPLITALSDSDNSVRIYAAQALGRIGNPIAVEPLITTINDSNSGVRRNAGAALGEIGNPIAVKPLLTALVNDSHFLVRFFMARALGKIENPIAVEALVTALNHSDNSLRRKAAEALGRIGNPIAVKPLITALNDSNNSVRIYAAQALGGIGNSIAVEPLITALSDSDNSVRIAAAQALGRIGNPIAVEPLITALNDSNNLVRIYAAAALVKIGNPIAIEPLVTALNDSDNSVRREATSALGKIGNSIAIEPLITALNDSDFSVRWQAAMALDNIGNPIAVKPLITALNDSNSSVRNSAAEALAKIGNSETLAKIIQSTEIDIYCKDIFPLARTLALRFSKKPPRNKKGQPFIPVYPELVRFKQAWLFVKSSIFKKHNK